MANVFFSVHTFTKVILEFDILPMTDLSVNLSPFSVAKPFSIYFRWVWSDRVFWFVFFVLLMTGLGFYFDFYLVSTFSAVKLALMLFFLIFTLSSLISACNFLISSYLSSNFLLDSIIFFYSSALSLSKVSSLLS